MIATVCQVGNVLAASATCGTGPGQTPFTIQASVASDYNGQDISCNGADDGVAAVTVTGGVGPFAYQWVGGPSPAFTQNYHGLGAGTYTVIVTDLGQGISCVDNVQLTEPAQLAVLFFMSSPPSCAGSCDGTATPVVIGGVGPYAYSWGNGETTLTASALCEGATALTITDFNGCELVTTYTAMLDETQPNLTTTDVLCNGANSGSASVAPSGGNGGPYTVLWSTGDSGLNLSGLGAGNYTVQITDAGGCTVSQPFLINEEPPIAISIDEAIDLDCATQATGVINASATGGTPPYTFNFSGPNGFSVTGAAQANLEAGTYVVTVTDANDCVATETITLTSPPEIVATAAVTAITCNGDSNGAIDLSVSGGVPGYGYTWTGPNGFTSNAASLTGLSAGSYAVLISDANGCEAQWSLDLEEPDALVVNAIADDVSCNGLADGSAQATAEGGTAPYTFAWSGQAGFTANGETLNNLAAGSYTVTVTDALGCSNFMTIDVEQPEALDISVSIDPITCNGANDATISAMVSGGTAPYTFFWTGPHGVSNDPVVLNAPIGGYNLTVTDANGCQQVAAAVVAEPDPLVLVPVISTPSCGGANDGSIELTILGGTPDYTIVWSGPNGFTATTASINDLEAGTYNATITDFAGCETVSSYTVTQTAPIALSLNATQVSCNGANDGAIDLEISGGQGPFSINWAGPNVFTSTAQNIELLEPGTYNVLVVDSSGCFEEAAVTIQEPDAIDASVDFENPSCFGLNDGSISVSTSGGNAPITIAWLTGETTFDLVGLPAGLYSATLTDAAGCSVNIGPVALAESPEIEAAITTSDVDCTENANGSIVASVTGGSGALALSWSGPNGFASDQQTLTNLEPGSYTLTVTDETGCEFVQTVTIDQPEAILVTITSTNPVCADDLINILPTISGGTPPYAVAWSGPNGFASNELSLIGVNQGTYTLDLQDDNGCSFQSTLTVEAPDPLTVSGTVSPLDCTGDPIGAITLDINGGVEPYNVNWTGSNGFNSFNPNISGLEAALYTVVVSDALGCEIITAFTISEPDALIVDASTTQPSCNGNSDGAIALTVAGGTPAYSFSWTGPNGFAATNQMLNNLTVGDYTVVIDDSDNCSETLTITLSEPSPITLNTEVGDVLCGGADDGAITLTITGGTPSYQVLWSAPGFSANESALTDLPAGNYQLDVLDANGCQAEAIVTVSENTPIAVDVEVTDSTCGDANGEAVATASGGTGDLTYQWFEAANPIATGPTASLLPSGNYSLEVTDSLGCAVTLAISISDSDAIELEAAATDPTCSDANNGTIALSLLGGSGTLTFEWTGPNGFASDNQNIADLNAGTYTVNVADDLGCFASLTVDLNSPAPIELSLAVTNVSCDADANGSIDLDVTGGTEPYTILWTGPNGFTNDGMALTNLPPGTYQVSVTDQQLCVANASATVEQSEAIAVDVAITDITCSGDANGAISLLINSGNPPFDVLWTGPAGFSTTDADLENLVAGDYQLTISDAAGCSLENLYTVTEGVALTIDLETVEPTCNTADGALTATVSGGSGLYAFFWYDLNNGNALIGTDAELTDLSAGNYYLEVIDSNGCAAELTIGLSDASGEINAQVTGIACFGESNAGIAVTVSGATPPFAYLWSGPAGFTADEPTLTDLGPGEYFVQVDDAAGCTFFGAYTITEPALLTVATLASEVLCNGDSNGNVLSSATGGTTPYAFVWEGDNDFSATTADIFDLPAGCYELTVTDTNGCTVLDQACVNEQDELLLTTIPTALTCSGGSNGSIELSISGGTGNVSVSWSGPDGFTSNEESIFSLFAGTYTLTATDENGCSSTSEVELTENPPIIVEANPTPPSCQGESDGTLGVLISGGVAPYFVEWFDEQGGPLGTGLTLEGFAPGMYGFSVSDVFGCTADGELELLDATPITVDAEVSDAACVGVANGQITIQISGGSIPYSTFWVGPNGYTNTAPSIADLSPGTYELTVGDGAGCSAQFSYTILQPIGIEVVIDDLVFASCPNSADGSIAVSVSGGLEPYHSTWSSTDGFTGEGLVIENLDPSTYTLTVTDANGCSTVVNNIPIGFLGDVTVFAGDDQAFCLGNTLGLTGTQTGATNSFWSDEAGNILAQGDQYIAQLDPGVYTFVYTGVDGGCVQTDTLTVEVWPPPVANAGSDQTLYPEDQAILGGNPTTNDDHLITWSPTEWLVDDDVPNPMTHPLVQSATFYLEVIDLNGCAAQDSVTINIIPDLDIPSGFTPNDDGMNDVWVLENAELYPSLVVEIYNRWGELLYRADRGYLRPWDGTYNGSPVPIGTYYYIIEIKEPNFEATVNGPLTILR